MAIEKVRCRAKMTRPYLWHNPAEDTFDGKKKKKTEVAGNDPEEWRKTYTATPDGRLYIKPEQVFAAVRAGAQKIKQGRGTLKADMASTLEVEEAMILLPLNITVEDTPPTNDFNAPLYIDKRTVRNPATRAMNMRYRLAASPGVEFEFTLAFDNTIVNKNQVAAAVEDAGRFAGIGDSRSIGKGRFEVLSIEPVAT